MSASEIDVAYLYEHAARELDVACIVVAELRSKYGLRCEIFQWPIGYARSVASVKPRLVVLPYCYSDASWRLLARYWPDATLFNLAWEQLFCDGNRTAKTPRGTLPLSRVIHHAWSDGYQRFLIRQGIARDRIFLNGNPGLQLYQEPYRGHFPNRNELARRHNLDPRRRWVFFPENYNWAFFSPAVLERFVTCEGLRSEDVGAMRDYCESSLKILTQWLGEIASQEHVEIILRPRPGISHNDFSAVLKRNLTAVPSHLHVIPHGTVREWIMASDVVLSSHSSSLIEAAVAGKPAFITEPIAMPRTLTVKWHGLLAHLHTLEEVRRACLDGESDVRLKHWSQDNLMGRGDSVANLAAFIASLLQNRQQSTVSQTKDRSEIGWVPPVKVWSLLQRARTMVRYTRTGGADTVFVSDVVPAKVIEEKIHGWAKEITNGATLPSWRGRAQFIEKLSDASCVE